MDAKSLFPTRLKQLREEAGLSQKELGSKSGLAQNSISQWELGKREPSWSNVVALASALGVDCRAFLDQPPAVITAESPEPTPEPPGKRPKRR